MIEWNKDVIDQLGKTIEKNIEKAGIYFKGKVKEALNVTGLPYKASAGPKGIWYKNEDVSEPGEPPHKMLGDLQRSIAHELSSDRQTVFVGTNLDYGKHLELGTTKMAARPYLRSTLAKEQQTINKIVATGTK